MSLYLTLFLITASHRSVTAIQLLLVYINDYVTHESEVSELAQNCRVGFECLVLVILLDTIFNHGTGA